MMLNVVQETSEQIAESYFSFLFFILFPGNPPLAVYEHSTLN